MSRTKWVLAFGLLVLGAVVLWTWALPDMRPAPSAPEAERQEAMGADAAPTGSSSDVADAVPASGSAASPAPEASPAGGGATSAPVDPGLTVAGGAASAGAGAGAGNPGTRQSPTEKAPDVADLLAGVDLANPHERERVALMIEEQEEARWQSVVEKARALGVPEFVKKPEGGVMEIFDFEGDEPVYRTTFNHNAGISSGADVLRGGGFENLTGRGLKVGVWDGGSVRPTHQEFGEGQVTLRNADRPYDDHATHVAATLAGNGFQPEAQGMAPEAKVDSYFWRNDHGEMTLAGAALPSGEAGKIPLSNHSYGIVFMAASAGHYERLARANDAVAYGLPYYLQFWAAGNAQKWRPGGYFTITHYQLAKNIVTVGAVNDAVKNGVRSPADGTMSDFSSWGPVNDGRIKPDLVANGVGLYSAIDFSDQSYAVYRGTSMASPSAAGTAALLVDLYRREFNGQLPLASLLKAILIHTADDLGRPGPDYQYGWGLINGQRAGDLIKEHASAPNFFAGTVTSEQRRWTHTFVRAEGNTTPLRATLVWTDPPGEVRSATSRVPNLVHNLDLKVVGPDGEEHWPYVMPYVGDWSPEALAADATRGKNDVDNVEQVEVDGLLPGGEYTLMVTADGAMVAPQSFSVVLTGAGVSENPKPVVNLQSPRSGTWSLPGRPVVMAATATDLNADGSAGTIAKVEFWVDGESVGEAASVPYGYDLWVPPGPGSYTVEAVAYDAEGAAGYSNPAVIEVREPLPGELHPAFTPPAANNAVLALTEDGDGRIYIGGQFTLLNGDMAAPRLARLAADGSVDERDFAVGQGANGRVRVLQFSGSHSALYVAGDFTMFNAEPRAALVRLHIGHADHADGEVDASFAPEVVSTNPLIKPSVRAVLLQPDGKIVIGGLFDEVNGVPRRHLARLHANGTLDEDFDPSPNSAVAALALESDGKILVGGEFTAVGTTTRNRLARLQTDGSDDSSLVLGTGQQTGFNGPVYALATDGEGNIFAGGSFTAYRGHPYHANLVKLRTDGALAGYFNFEPGLNGTVHDLVVGPEGAVLVAGAFTEAGNTLLGIRPAKWGRILQFLSDGRPDENFNADGAGADGTVHRVLRLSSGRLLLAGSFARFNGATSARLALLGGAAVEEAEKSTAAITMGTRALVESAAGGVVDMVLVEGHEQALGHQLSGVLPQGLRFDGETGRLTGVALEAGGFEATIRVVGADGRISERLVEISVEPAAVSYQQWCAAWFAAGEETCRRPQAIHNDAGLSNFEVYAFSGGDPRRATAALRPSIQVNLLDGTRQADWSVPKFRWANYGGVTNVLYQPEVASEPGGPWYPAEPAVEGDRLRVQGDDFGAKQFFRIKLVQP